MAAMRCFFLHLRFQNSGYINLLRTTIISDPRNYITIHISIHNLQIPETIQTHYATNVVRIILHRNTHVCI